MLNEQVCIFSILQAPYEVSSITTALAFLMHIYCFNAYLLLFPHGSCFRRHYFAGGKCFYFFACRILGQPHQFSLRYSLPFFQRCIFFFPQVFVQLLFLFLLLPTFSQSSGDFLSFSFLSLTQLFCLHVRLFCAKLSSHPN